VAAPDNEENEESLRFEYSPQCRARTLRKGNIAETTVSSKENGQLSTEADELIQLILRQAITAENPQFKSERYYR